MRNEMNPTHIRSRPHPPTQHNTTVNAPPKKRILRSTSLNKNQVMNDLPFVRVEVRLHTHVVGYLVAEASSLDRRVELYASW